MERKLFCQVVYVLLEGFVLHEEKGIELYLLNSPEEVNRGISESELIEATCILEVKKYISCYGEECGATVEVTYDGALAAHMIFETFGEEILEDAKNYLKDKEPLWTKRLNLAYEKFENLTKYKIE